jgi:CO dehydrogenase/acetyl-CoA synthase beta subunit
MGLYHKMVTQEDVKNVDEFIKFLNKVQHLGYQRPKEY